MNLRPPSLQTIVLLMSLLAGCASRPIPSSFPEVSALAPQAAPPDPLVMLDGRRITSREQWFGERRPELKALFQHYMYGAIPPKPANLQANVVAEYRDFLGGKATLKLVSLTTGPAGAPRIDLMLVLPNKHSGRCRCFSR